MITFDPVTPAPLATRIARVVLPLLTCFGYLAFRAYPAAQGRIPLGEAVVMSLVIMGLAMVTCIALGDLIYPATPRARQRPTTEELEITAVHAPIADAETVVARSCAEEIARLDALIAYAGEDARATAGLFHGTLPAGPLGARTPFVELEDTQPYDLLTHEFQPQHHTPPGGFTMYPDGGPDPFEVPGSWTSWLRREHEHAVDEAPTGRHHRDED